MKARVKATGALLIVRPYDDSNFDWICDMGGENGTLWKTEQLDFIDDFEPDYWEKLKHQYAGMAMQGILSNEKMFETITERACRPDKPAYIAERCDKYATALVNKLKEDSQCEK